MSRRSRFVGRPLPGSRRGGGAWRSRGGSGGVRSSKSFRASSADPRRSPRPAIFRTRRRPRGSETVMRSPARTRRAGFAASSLTSTLPPSHATEAWLRVLNTRAAQSHLSTRIESSEPCTGRRYHSDKGARTMTRFAVPILVMLFTAVAWAADVVTIEDWKTQKLGSHGIPDGWLGGQTWGLPQHDMTIEENDGHRVLHLRSKIESSTIRKDIKGKVNLKETPILEWTWKAVVLPTNADCRKKAADDQAAQLYVVWPRFPEAVRSQIIGYIWDTTCPAGSIRSEEHTSELQSLRHLVCRLL